MKACSQAFLQCILFSGLQDKSKCFFPLPSPARQLAKSSSGNEPCLHPLHWLAIMSIL